MSQPAGVPMERRWGIGHAVDGPMARVTRIPRARPDRSRALAEVEALAWLLDNSIPVPGTGGRRFGMDAVIGFVPVVGDLVSGGIGLFVVWRGARLGLPRVVVARMLVNSAIDLAVGSIPVVGDAFDLWFKANTRNLGLMRRHLEQPELPTRDEWLVLLGLVGVVVLVVALVGWLLVSLLTTVVGGPVTPLRST
jgi:preprotein translocase subunit Sss1